MSAAQLSQDAIAEAQRILAAAAKRLLAEELADQDPETVKLAAAAARMDGNGIS